MADLWLPIGFCLCGIGMNWALIEGFRVVWLDYDKMIYRPVWQRRGLFILSFVPWIMVVPLMGVALFYVYEIIAMFVGDMLGKGAE